MKKIIKIVSISTGLILLFIIIVAILLSLLIRPNHLKPIISKQVYRATGRQLSFQSDLHWSLFPNIGIESGQATLSNDKNSDNTAFAMIDHAKINIQLLPLFEKKIKINAITLSGLTINMVKNRQGTKTNIPTIRTPSSFHQESNQEKSFSKVDFNISRLSIKNVTLNWKDLQSGMNTQIKNLTLRATNIQSSFPFPIFITLDFQNNHPNIHGKIKLTSNMLFNEKQNRYDAKNLNLSAHLHGDTLPNGHLDCEIKTELSLSQNKFSAHSILIKWNKTYLTGYLNIDDLSRTKGQFNLTGNKLNLDDFLNIQNKTISNEHTTSSQTHLNEKTQPSLTWLKNLNLTGQVSLKQLTMMKTNIEQINMKVRSKNGTLYFVPITAHLYQGRLNGVVHIDLQNASPIITPKIELTQINIEPLLYDVLGYKNLSGIGNLTLNLSTQGITSKTMLPTLDGQIALFLKNGAIKKIDITHLIQKTRAIIKKEPMPLRRGENQTNFGDLTGTATIKNGILLNNDLHLLSKEMEVHGKGSANLITQQLDYTLSLSDPDKDASRTIPVQITGSFKHPKQRIKIEEMTRNILTKEIEKKITDKLRKLKISTHLF